MLDSVPPAVIGSLLERLPMPKRRSPGQSRLGLLAVRVEGYSLFLAVESVFAFARRAFRFAVDDLAVVDFAALADFDDFFAVAVLSAFFACCVAWACSFGAATNISAAAAAAIVRRFIPGPPEGWVVGSRTFRGLPFPTPASRDGSQPAPRPRGGPLMPLTTSAPLAPKESSLSD